MANVKLSKDELELVTNAELILTKNRIIQKVYDLFGRQIEVKNNVAPNSSVQLGGNYISGVYMVDIIQGDKRQQLKLVKQWWIVNLPAGRQVVNRDEWVISEM